MASSGQSGNRASAPRDEERCTATSQRSGERCRNRAVPGSNLCGMHGGRTPDEAAPTVPAPTDARETAETTPATVEPEPEPDQVPAAAPASTRAAVVDVRPADRRLSGMERLRTILAAVLVILGALSLMFASTGWWLERNFLDTPRFTDTADRVLDRDEVKAALSLEIVKQINQSTGRDLDLIEPFIASIVGQVVDSGAFRRVFDAAVSTAHRALVDREIPEVTIDLQGTYQDIRSAVRAVSPRVARDMPKDVEINIDVIDTAQLEGVWDAIDLVENIVLGLTIAAIVCLLGGIALSLRRWRTAALAAWVAVGSFTVFLIGLAIARRFILGQIENVSYEEAAGAAWDVVTHGLLVQTILFLVIGAVIAIAAGWTGRHGGLAGARDAVVAGYQWVREALPAPVPGEPAPAPGTLTPATATAAGEQPRTVETVGSTVGTVVARLRLPEPAENARARHIWRAIGLVAVAVFIFVWPEALTTVVIVAVGLLVLYLATTEVLAAVASRRQPAVPAPGTPGS